MAITILILSMMSIRENAYSQTDEVTSDALESLPLVKDQARQILLEPQKFIEMCKLHYQSDIEALPWTPVGQMSRYLFYVAEAQGDKDFLDRILMTYVRLGLEINYNRVFTLPQQRQMLLPGTLCEDYINVVAVEAATHLVYIGDDEYLKKRFEEFKNIHNSWVPYILFVGIDDAQYVFNQIRKQANTKISPENATTSDYAISRFIRGLPSDVRYTNMAYTIIDPLAHSAVNSLIRVAALQATDNVYILRWHASYDPVNQPSIENTRSEELSPFYISDEEEEMQMYRNIAQQRLMRFGLPLP